MRSEVEAVMAAADVAERLEDTVAARIAANRLRSAVAWTRATASFCVTNPTGFLRSPVLEGHVEELARRVHRIAASDADGSGARASAGDKQWRSAADGRRLVLHVISETHVLGGHRSVLLRWLELDTDSRADVVVTRPVGMDSQLIRTVRKQGGQLRLLTGRDVLERSRDLRRLARAYDLIIVHAHPDDALIAVGLFDECGDLPRQVMVDHADHVFWLRPGSPALHVSVRPAAMDTAVRLRGVPAEAATWMPIPVEVPATGRARERARFEARAALRIPGETVLAVTVAREVKYRRSPHHPGFLDVVIPAVQAARDVHVLAVGPNPSDLEWTRARAATQGRIRAVGSQPNPGLFLAAADIYLDPFPFTSHTSMLESAAHGLPVLAGSRYTGTASLLGASTLLSGAAIVAPSNDSYSLALRDLSRHRDSRASAAAAAHGVILRQHVGEAWLRHLRGVLRQVGEPGAAARCRGVERDLDYAQVLGGTESHAPLQWILAAARDDLDLPDRLRVGLRSWERRTARWFTDAPLPIGTDDAGAYVPPRRERTAS